MYSSSTTNCKIPTST
jgi:CBS domain-containing protein